MGNQNTSLSPRSHLVTKKLFVKLHTLQVLQSGIDKETFLPDSDSDDFKRLKRKNATDPLKRFKTKMK